MEWGKRGRETGKGIERNGREWNREGERERGAGNGYE